MRFDAQDKRFPFDPPEAVQANLLECFDYEYPGRDISIVNVTEEFTSVCPFSGLPDFATVTLEYIPDRKVLELRALKYYLLTYRNVGMFYEHLVNKMLEDLVRVCRPKQMSLKLECTPRGGIRTTVTAEHPR
ncbi:NADPH-dependent 7-cyano-7-deazaguanine reductase QueF [bacterium]|nr:NADPH-dependent 7-cyano-7-deazaguanine reductase QueF [bacterium]